MTGAPAAASAQAGSGHPVWHYAAVAGVAVAMFVGLRVWDWVRAHPAFRLRPRAATSADLALAAGSAACGMIHLDVCPAHFREAVAFGAFFIVAALLQLGWAALVWNGP